MSNREIFKNKKSTSAAMPVYAPADELQRVTGIKESRKF